VADREIAVASSRWSAMQRRISAGRPAKPLMSLSGGSFCLVADGPVAGISGRGSLCGGAWLIEALASGFSVDLVADCFFPNLRLKRFSEPDFMAAVAVSIRISCYVQKGGMILICNTLQWLK
jgi:hypothetical protein